MIGTVWFDHALQSHLVIVKDVTSVTWDDTFATWECFILDGELEGRVTCLYDFEFKHKRFEKVG